MKTQLLLVIMFGCAICTKSSTDESDRKTSCWPRYKWIDAYNMFVDKLTFTTQHTHKQYYYKENSNETESLRRTVAIAILQVGSIQPFRWWNNTKIINYLHGAAVTIHTINAYTGEYSKSVLGWQSKKLFKVIGKDYWFVVDVTPYKNQNFGVVSMTMTFKRNDPYESFKTMKWGKRSEMIQMFPHLKEVISKFTPGEN